jgi:hypothetical protein
MDRRMELCCRSNWPVLLMDEILLIRKGTSRMSLKSGVTDWPLDGWGCIWIRLTNVKSWSSPRLVPLNVSYTMHRKMWTAAKGSQQKSGQALMDLMRWKCDMGGAVKGSRFQKEHWMFCSHLSKWTLPWRLPRGSWKWVGSWVIAVGLHEISTARQIRKGPRPESCLWCPDSYLSDLVIRQRECGIMGTRSTKMVTDEMKTKMKTKQ